MTRFVDLIPWYAREPLTVSTFFRYIAPAGLCYYMTAVLVLIQNTSIIRLAILPMSLWTCYNGATRLDLVKSYDDETLVYINQALVAGFTLLSMRMIVWSFQAKPFQRVGTLGDITPGFYIDRTWPWPPKDLFISAVDLCCNLRGCGWSRSPRLQILEETRPTSSTRDFARATSTSLVFYIIMVDTLQYAVQWLAPLTVGSARGGSIFDTSIPPSLRYFKSTILVILVDMLTYCYFQAGDHMAMSVGVLVFQQDTSLWPPAFEAPWLSTSLSGFWAKRWHQFFRDIFSSIGGKPMSLLFGRVGGVFGTFFVSGFLHYCGLWGMGRGADFSRVGGFFIVNGMGIILEHVWRRTTGHRVSGQYGRLWAYMWVIGSGHLLVEGWATKGLIGSTFIPQYLRLTTYIFGTPLRC